MATLKNGFISGRIGDKVFSELNGKQCIRSLPDRSNFVPSEAQKYHNRCFAMACAFSHAALRVRVIRDAWNDFRMKVEGSPNKMMKVNMPLLKNQGDISACRLVPNPGLFPVRLEDFSWVDHRVSGTFFIDKAPGLSTLVSLQGVVYLEEPVKRKMKPVSCVHFCGSDFPFEAGQPFAVDSLFMSQDLEVVKCYLRKKIIMNLAFKKEQGIVEVFSEKFIQDII